MQLQRADSANVWLEKSVPAFFAEFPRRTAVWMLWLCEVFLCYNAPCLVCHLTVAQGIPSCMKWVFFYHAELLKYFWELMFGEIRCCYPIMFENFPKMVWHNTLIIEHENAMKLREMTRPSDDVWALTTKTGHQAQYPSARAIWGCFCQESGAVNCTQNLIRFSTTQI